MAEKNGSFVRVIFWTLILASFGWATATFLLNVKYASAIDKGAQERDIAVEIRLSDKVDRNQKEIREDIASLNKNQAEFNANQKWIVDTLKEIKNKI